MGKRKTAADPNQPNLPGLDLDANHVKTVLDRFELACMAATAVFTDALDDAVNTVKSELGLDGSGSSSPHSSSNQPMLSSAEQAVAPVKKPKRRGGRPKPEVPFGVAREQPGTPEATAVALATKHGYAVKLGAVTPMTIAGCKTLTEIVAKDAAAASMVLTMLGPATAHAEPIYSDTMEGLWHLAHNKLITGTVDEVSRFQLNGGQEKFIECCKYARTRLGKRFERRLVKASAVNAAAAWLFMAPKDCTNWKIPADAPFTAAMINKITETAK